MQSGFGNKAKNARKTKTRREDVPWDPASDADLMFELTTMVILDPAAKGCPVHQIKVTDQFKSLLDPSKPMNADTGFAMAEWAMGRGEGRNQKAILDEVRAEARKGREAMATWWKDNAKHRTLAGTIMPELQQIAEDAEKRALQVTSDNPFADMPPADEDEAGDSMTPEQRAETVPYPSRCS